MFAGIRAGKYKNFNDAIELIIYRPSIAKYYKDKRQIYRKIHEKLYLNIHEILKGLN